MMFLRSVAAPIFIFTFLFQFVFSRRGRIKDEIKDESSSSNYDGRVQTRPTDYLLEPTSVSSNDKASRRLFTPMQKESITTMDIIKHHHYYSSNTACDKAMTGELLVYVTPWNRKGYDMAKIMSGKLNWLVPVWLQIDAANNQLVLSGQNDIDLAFLSDVQAQKLIQCSHCSDESADSNSEGDATCHKPENNFLFIVPRVVLQVELRSAAEVTNVVDMLVKASKQYKFDGYTLEMGSTSFDRGIELMRKLKVAKLKVIYVISPVVVDNQTRGAIKLLADVSDRIAIMTYDYGRLSTASAAARFNAPFYWVEEVIDSFLTVSDSIHDKLLLGLPLYGWKNGNEAMIGSTMIVWLAMKANDIQIIWDPKAKEHLFIDKVTGDYSSYPTSLFLKQRLDFAARKRLAGVAMWEIGQMMAGFLNVI